VKEVQVTLDGPQPVHDRRRPHASGRGTFERIVAGVDGLVQTGIPVNLRVVADRENLPTLPELAELAAAKGWLDLPVSRFKTQVGRNYDLFGCASRQRRDALFDRVELWARWLELAEAHPILRRFHRPRFHGIGHLAETGELPAPNFDGCPATKKEWAFGPDGRLYGCTATVGHAAHVLGTFHPEIARDDAAIATWRARSTLSMPDAAGAPSRRSAAAAAAPSPGSRGDALAPTAGRSWSCTDSGRILRPRRVRHPLTDFPARRTLPDGPARRGATPPCNRRSSSARNPRRTTMKLLTKTARRSRCAPEKAAQRCAKASGSCRAATTEAPRRGPPAPKSRSTSRRRPPPLSHPPAPHRYRPHEGVQPESHR
jgi:hypothetical protein